MFLQEPGLTGLQKNQLLNEEELAKYQDEFGEESFTAGIGAEAVLEKYGKKKLQEIEKNCQSTISARGINFRVYAANNRAEEKKWPLDIIPRIIPKSQWLKVAKGLAQRVKALNLFIDDVYNAKKIFKENIVTREFCY